MKAIWKEVTYTEDLVRKEESKQWSLSVLQKQKIDHRIRSCTNPFPIAKIYFKN